MSACSHYFGYVCVSSRDRDITLTDTAAVGRLIRIRHS